MYLVSKWVGFHFHDYGRKGILFEFGETKTELDMLGTPPYLLIETFGQDMLSIPFWG